MISWIAWSWYQFLPIYKCIRASKHTCPALLACPIVSQTAIHASLSSLVRSSAKCMLRSSHMGAVWWIVSEAPSSELHDNLWGTVGVIWSWVVYWIRNEIQLLPLLCGNLSDDICNNLTCVFIFLFFKSVESQVPSSFISFQVCSFHFLFSNFLC